MANEQNAAPVPEADHAAVLRAKLQALASTIQAGLALPP